MTKSIRSTVASLLGVALVATSLAVAAFPGTAAADTSYASADAANGLLNPSPEERSGNSAGIEQDDDPVLPSGPLLNVGVLGQDTFVDRFGHSAACAGLLATSAQVNIIDAGNGCANADESQGVEVNLIPGILTLGLDGVYAQCTAGSNELPTASAFVLGNLRLELLGIAGITLPAPTPGSPVNVANRLKQAFPLLSIPIDLALPGVVELALGQVDIGTTKGSGATATALHLNLLGIVLDVGIVKCGPNLPEGDSGQLVMDTSGDINVDNDPATRFVQDGTRNALTALYTPAGDRSATRASFVINTNKLEFDNTDPAFAGCDPVGLNDPSTSCTFAPNGPGGILVGGTATSRTVPVKIKPGITGTIDPADATVRYSNGTEPGADLDRQLSSTIGIRSETSTVVVQAGGNAPASGSPAGTQLPTNIPGQLFADVPYYVEYVEYDGEACTLRDDEDPVFAIPATYDQNLVPAQRNLFDCGSSIGANSGFRLTVAPDAPTNVDGTGRIVIKRTGPVSPLTPPAIPNNSYTSDLVIDVTAGPVPPAVGAVDVTASIAPASRPAPGGDFTYTVNVKNTTTVNETVQALTQRVKSNNGAFAAGPALAGDADCKIGTVLTPGQTCSFDYVDALSGVTGDTETHEFNATVKPANASPAVTDPTPPVLTAVLGDAQGLTVVKTVADNDLPTPGGDFTYTVKITNPNSAAITITTLKDKVGNNAPVDLTGDADCKIGTVLPAAGSCEFSFVLPFTGAVGAKQSDTVTITGTDPNGVVVTGVSNGVEVSIIDGSGLDVDLAATPASLPEPGGKVKFTLTAKNTLPAAANNANNLKLTSLKVQYNPTVDAKTMDESTCDVGATLKPGDTYSCTFTDEITGNADDVVTYKALGIAEDPDGDDFTSDGSATVTLTNVQPKIDAKLVPDPAARKTPGGDFKWTLTVTNTSPASSDPITILGLKDDLLPDMEKDESCKQLLGVTVAVGKSVSCSFITKVEGPDGKVATDLVVVDAEDDDDTATSDFAVASVSLTAADAAVTTTTVRTALPKTGASSRTTAAAAMLFAGLGLVLTGGGMQQAPELAVEGKRRRRR